MPSPALEIINHLSKQDFQAQEEIRTALSEVSYKSMRYAIRRLLENGILYRVPNLQDMRSVSYRLATQDELSSVLSKLSDNLFSQVIKAMELSNNYNDLGAIEEI